MNNIASPDYLDDKTIVKMLKNEYMKKRLPNDLMHIFFTENIPIQGHKGDIYGTFHEWLFSLLFPVLKKQVSFGTGKGGYSKYLCKCYVADFVDEQNKEIFEIDGKSHNRKICKLKDQLRTLFFNQKGYTVYRVTNEKVEELAVKSFRRKHERFAG